jgi:hypothetical protein
MPVRRVEPAHRHDFVEIGSPITARGSHGVRDQVRHGEHRRPCVEGKSVLVEHASTTTRQLFSFDHGDVVPASREVTRCGQAG